MNTKQSTSRWMRLKEVLVTTFLGWIPSIAFGAKLRNLLYRSIIARIGSSVYIQNGVEFLGSSCIEISDGVHIFKNVRLDAKGHENNKIYLGQGVALERGVEIGSLENSSIHISENTYIAPYVCIAGPGNIKIGKHCMIASHSGIYANNHNFADLNVLIREQGVTRKGIIIEDNCWLGHGVTVLDGVTIGQGSVIGAGSVVSKDIPAFSVAVGVPAKVIRDRQDKELDNNSRLDIKLSAALAKIEKTPELSYSQTGDDTVSPHFVLENLLSVLLDCIRQVMNVDTITILLPTKNGQQLAVCASIGLEEEIVEAVRIPIGQGFAGHIAASGEQMIVDDLSKVEVVSPILRNRGIQSMIGVPLLLKEGASGVFHVGTFRHCEFTKDDVQRLQLVGDRIGSAIEPFVTEILETSQSK
ncbi:GAF domain-containing protein [Scytonema hofmannii FACHB-248]|uniref:GAF domain-containing protein n=1 Tax=Scytonema hofmannii FACHB-248 TaxID=1842502 RepID=A0ABR8GVM5_9CYAN|nr:GAF domain-containing protein [Scytonema hofmannii FACHB-248]